MMAMIVWLVGFAGLLVWLVALATRVRSSRDHTVSRWSVVAAAVAIAVLGFSSAYVWGVDVAQRGMDRIAGSSTASATNDSTGQASPADRAAPATTGTDNGMASEPSRARLFLRYVQLLLAARPEERPDRGTADATTENPRNPQPDRQTGSNPGSPPADAVSSAGNPSSTPEPPAGQPTHRARIGYSPEAALRLPRSYGLDESRQGWDVLQVSASGPQGLQVAALSNPETTKTRVIIASRRRAITGPRSPQATARAARDVLGRTRRCPASSSISANAQAPGSASQTGARSGFTTASAMLDGPGAIYAIFCVESRPRAALVFERDLAARSPGDAGASDVPVRIIPLVWRGNRWRHHHVQISSGSLIQVGTMDDALPGITLWEVPAPSGRAELFYPPGNLLASCPEWLSGERGEGFFSRLAGNNSIEPIPAAERAHTDDSICVLPFTPPFGLEVRRLLPDLPGIAARSLWVAGLMTTPALLLLLLLCASARSQLSARRFQRLLTIGWIAVFLTAVGVWRLLWAHRIDMLRDYESVGPRVLDNQTLLVMGGASLAATCVLGWTKAFGSSDTDKLATGSARGLPTMLRHLGLSALAWLLWLVVGGYALRGDLAGIDPGGRLVGQLAVSLALGTAIAWVPLARSNARTLLTRWFGKDTGAPNSAATFVWLATVFGLGALCAVTAVSGTWLPRTVALKLTLAWAFILLVYAALRATIAPGGSLTRIFITAVASFVAIGLLFRFDPGVTVAIAGPGLIAALLFLSHDAHFAETALRRIDSYRRHHAPLLISHAALLIILGLAVSWWSLGGLRGTSDGEPDAMFAQALTTGALHLILFIAVLFVPAAALAYVRRGARAAIPWLFCAALFASLWALRGPVVDQVLGSSTQAANRIAIVVDPGYALLRSENKFLSGITAWRETIIPTASSSAAGEPEPMREPMREQMYEQMMDGQGYFGAQLIDPGVLLSIENDYFPVLVLREAGIRGIVVTTLLLLVLVAGLWILSGTRFRHGSAAQRARTLVAAVLGVVCIYQPLASLGTLPLTGIAWPGFGLDSPSDFWLLLGLVFWVLVWGPSARGPAHGPSRDSADRGDRNPAKDPDDSTDSLDRFDSELRRSRLFRRIRATIALTSAVVVVASLLLLSRSAAFALRRPNPVDPQGRAVKPFDDLDLVIDYVYHLQCPWSEKSAPVDRSANPGHSPSGTTSAADELIPDDLLGDPESKGGIARFHSDQRAAWLQHRPRAVTALDAFLSGQAGCGDARSQRATLRGSPWSMGVSPEDADECRMTFKTGWPEIELIVQRHSGSPDRDEADDRTESTGDDNDTNDTVNGNGTEDGSKAAEPVASPAVASHSARCRIDVRAEVLRKLRFPSRRPFRDARVRLVSRAMGAAARDRGELVSGHLIVRLRPDAGEVDVSRARAGLYHADEVRISDELTVLIQRDRTVLRRRVQPTGETDNWLFVRDPPGQTRDPGARQPAPDNAPDGSGKPGPDDRPAGRASSRVRVLEASEGTWRLLPPDVEEIELARMALVVVGGPDARSLWLFRPPTEWPGEEASVHPLVADDVSTVLGERRRHYLFGGLLPEIGWVNPYHRRMSLGLDGWVHVAMTEYEASRPHDPVWLDGADREPYCGTLDPPGGPSDELSRNPGAGADAIRPGSTEGSDPGRPPSSLEQSISNVCAPSPLDGVLECRVALQPELAIRLRHLSEMISLEPDRFAGQKPASPIRAGYVLLRGDTGEIVAQGEFVPGRASSAYAPATPEIEKHLVRLREDRDPVTGRKLPPGLRGEASAEKVEWSQPMAFGSTMKPILARAAELADPDFTRALRLDGAPASIGLCRNRGGRRGRQVHAILGHCPPTESLWNQPGRVDMTRFLSVSINWYQAALGLLGTAIPNGSWGFGEPVAAPGTPGIPISPDSGLPAPDSARVTLADIVARNPGSHAPDAALWARHRGKQVITASQRVRLETLRQTRMWQRFEQLLGRPLCTAGNKSTCVRQNARRDLCAARALPIRSPTRDLRHLVALGPGAFDFYPRLADPRRRVGPWVSTREYLQFLRGSGIHPLGSLAQLTDAFNRVIYAHAHDPTEQGGYRLAASWFPVDATGSPPGWSCSSNAPSQSPEGDGIPDGVADGLCQALRQGTLAAPMAPFLADPGLVFYGGKTGTIDSLADVAENLEACEHFRTGHTITDRPADDRSQPYWLACGEKRTSALINDSLVVISFGVRTDVAAGSEPGSDATADRSNTPSARAEPAVIPLTLGLRFQRSGPGFATRVAPHYIDAIRAYFARPSPSQAPAGP